MDVVGLWGQTTDLLMNCTVLQYIPLTSVELKLSDSFFFQLSLQSEEF